MLFSCWSCFILQKRETLNALQSAKGNKTMLSKIRNEEGSLISHLCSKDCIRLSVKYTSSLQGCEMSHIPFDLFASFSPSLWQPERITGKDLAQETGICRTRIENLVRVLNKRRGGEWLQLYWLQKIGTCCFIVFVDSEAEHKPEAPVGIHKGWGPREISP